MVNIFIGPMGEETNKPIRKPLAIISIIAIYLQQRYEKSSFDLTKKFIDIRLFLVMAKSK